MSIEERVETLERRIEELEQTTIVEYVTPKQLAEILQCSTNHIYVKIREGEIKTLHGLGSCLRIPMSQFRGSNIKKEKKVSKDSVNKVTDIKDVRNWVWQN